MKHEVSMGRDFIFLSTPTGTIFFITMTTRSTRRQGGEEEASRKEKIQCRSMKNFLIVSSQGNLPFFCKRRHNNEKSSALKFASGRSEKKRFHEGKDKRLILLLLSSSLSLERGNNMRMMRNAEKPRRNKFSPGRG